MGLTIEAVYENGVFVPAQWPALAEHERVRLTVEPVAGAGTPGGARPAADPRRGERIKIDPDLAREIASSAEFHPDNG